MMAGGADSYWDLFSLIFQLFSHTATIIWHHPFTFNIFLFWTSSSTKTAELNIKANWVTISHIAQFPRHFPEFSSRLQEQQP